MLSPSTSPTPTEPLDLQDQIPSAVPPIPSPSNPAQGPSTILLCSQLCLCARSIPRPSRDLVPSLLGLLHSSRDVTAVLHQLEPVILHDPPWDGHIACPQAAVEDVIPTMHWRRNTSCRLSSTAPLPASPEGEGAVAGWRQEECCHTLPWLDTQLYCAHTPVQGALSLLLTESKGDG